MVTLRDPWTEPANVVVTRKDVTVLSLFHHREIKIDGVAKVFVVVIREGMARFDHPEYTFFRQRIGETKLGTASVQTLSFRHEAKQTANPSGGSIGIACTATVTCEINYDSANATDTKYSPPLEVKFAPGERAKAVFLERVDPSRIATIRVGLRDAKAASGPVQCGIAVLLEQGGSDDPAVAEEAQALVDKFDPEPPVDAEPPVDPVIAELLAQITADILSGLEDPMILGDGVVYVHRNAKRESN